MVNNSTNMSKKLMDKTVALCDDSILNTPLPTDQRKFSISFVNLLQKIVGHYAPSLTNIHTHTCSII